MVNGYSPTSLAEALALNATGELTPYAGGTDLMVENHPGRTFLFLGRVPELGSIAIDENHVRIGACVTFAQALADTRVPAIMREAVAQIGSPAVRNFGTFGGNLANGSDKADTVPVAFAMGAKLRLASSRGERMVDVEDLHLGLKKVDLANDELIVELLLPRKSMENYCFHKVGGRRAMAISHVTFAAILEESGEKINELAVSFGAVADKVLRFRDLEAMLAGQTKETARTLKKDLLAAYASRLVTVNGRVGAAYCKTVCLNLLRDFLERSGI